MANCHDLFQKLHDEIKLPASKRDALKKAKDALRKRVKEYFSKELKTESPKFWSQGSYALGTIVNPLDKEYDIDDGIYLQHLSDEKDQWPTPEAVHKWIYDAVKGHTQEDPIDKRTCVRVVYSGEYHVDLPIYSTFEDEYYLAEKGENGWTLSDPIAISEWFIRELKQKGDQLKRVVRYLKAWGDFKSKSNGIKLPSGLILTVLATEHYISTEYDDSAFVTTAKNIYQKISNDFTVYNPIDSNEILTARLTDAQKKNFISILSNLLGNASKAFEENDEIKASELWISEFGDRFPKSTEKSKIAEPIIITSRPASPHGVKWTAW